MESSLPSDVLLLVPFQPMLAMGIDPIVRQTLGTHYGLPLAQAIAEFEGFLGRPPNSQHWKDHPLLAGSRSEFQFLTERSLTVIPGKSA